MVVREMSYQESKRNAGKEGKISLCLDTTEKGHAEVEKYFTGDEDRIPPEIEALYIIEQDYVVVGSDFSTWAKDFVRVAKELETTYSLRDARKILKSLQQKGWITAKECRWG